jgi:capsular polysaccharide transport system permease protein
MALVSSPATIRSPGQVTWSVWKALFLREAIARLTAGRAAWVWLILEPVSHVAIWMLIYMLLRSRTPFGVPGPTFYAIGVLGFMMMRNVFSRSTSAVNANAALFAYRQVKPIDTVLVRAALEGFLLILVSLLVLAGSAALNFDVVPHDPLTALLALAFMWQAGLGLGLIFSVGTFLVPEIGKVVDMMNRPLYMASCVLCPSLFIPQPYRDWIMLNPFAHGVESLRKAFFPSYQVPAQTNLIYLAVFGQLTVFIGIALHIRFSKRLTAL